MNLRTLTSLSSGLVLALITARASAQNVASGGSGGASGFALDAFNPSERGSEWFALDALDFRGEARPAFGVVGDWAYKPLVAYGTDGKERAVPVRHQVFLDVGASLVLFERLRASFDMPVALASAGDGTTVNGATVQTPAGTSFGDLRFGLDLRLFGRYGGPITGALGAQVFTPTGNRAAYAGDGKVRLLPHLAIAGDLGPFVYALRSGVEYRALDDAYAGNTRGTELVFGLAAGVRVASKNLVLGPELYGRTVLTNGAAFQTASTPVEGVLGFHYTVPAAWLRFGAGAGTGFSRGLGSPQARVLASLEIVPSIDEKKAEAPPPSDRDHDGIVDDEDACPDDKGPKSELASENGCPDRDKDGVIDRKDACPGDPGPKTSDPKTSGCPDRDEDGVLDKDDACPDEKGVATDDPKTNGCPVKENPDRDGDGILNDADACPDTPGEADPDPKKNGCPRAEIVGDQIKIRDQVKFKTASSQIQAGRESEDVLFAVMKILKDHPAIRVRVEGHTDNKGSAANNRVLSKGRAASVVAWLEKHGIDASRLSSQGFGQDKPIDTNDTEDGRHNNRRVEIHIVGERDQ